MLKTKSISADQIDVNDSLNPRVDITAQDIKASIPVNPKIEYHHPAMRRRDEPPQRESASNAVYVEREVLMLSPLSSIHCYCLLISLRANESILFGSPFA
mmetsp:Transcript_17728/g.40507  ORF Transcript_17728/g.40507 Transcript_17728/m.40507 type:complete len:100 (-) Transcript_17728:230-529(-)